MIVRLTNTQRQRIYETVSTTEMPVERLKAFHRWWEADLQGAPRHRVDGAMPAIAWEMVQQIMFDKCYDHRGFRAKTLKISEHGALKSVTAACNARRSHPALNNLAVIGDQREIVPAWTNHLEMSPVPDDTHRNFVLMMPVRVTMGQGRVATRWAETKPEELPVRTGLLVGDEHQAFL